MSAEEWSWNLQWQPMELAPTKEQRWEKARRKRKENQKRREELVLFYQSFLFCAGLAAMTVGMIILL